MDKKQFNHGWTRMNTDKILLFLAMHPHNGKSGAKNKKAAALARSGLKQKVRNG